MILVAGATGDLGGRVVALLRERAEDVRCLVRVATDDAGLRSLGAETVRGDLTDPSSLTAACASVDTIIATATVIARRLAGASSTSRMPGQTLRSERRWRRRRSPSSSGSAGRRLRW